MKRIPFPLNERDFKIEYHKTREGPNGFMCYYKNAATYNIDPLEAWRTLGIARFTDTGKKLKEWCLDMQDQHGHQCFQDENQDNPENTFFEPGNMAEPNDNTKMVV